jgi:glycosyltransferase involved in cell wall biosynthesis
LGKISVIVCSIDPVKARAIDAHYRLLLGEQPHQIIAIGDAGSLAEAYNRGVDRAAGDVIIFSHDDIEFLEPASWLATLTAHLAQFDLIGLAGTDRLVAPAWAAAGPPHTFGQVGELDGKAAPYRVLLCAVPLPVIPDMQAIDGLFMATHRRVLEAVRFDAETFDGFHSYDIDFSFRAHLAGFKVAVAADLPVLHASQGKFDQKWQHYAQRFAAKHASRLPAFKTRPFHHAVVGARSKQELLEILSGPRSQWRVIR